MVPIWRYVTTNQGPVTLGAPWSTRTDEPRSYPIPPPEAQLADTPIGPIRRINSHRTEVQDQPRSDGRGLPPARPVMCPADSDQTGPRSQRRGLQLPATNPSCSLVVRSALCPSLSAVTQGERIPEAAEAGVSRAAIPQQNGPGSPTRPLGGSPAHSSAGVGCPSAYRPERFRSSLTLPASAQRHPDQDRPRHPLRHTPNRGQ